MRKYLGSESAEIPCTATVSCRASLLQSASRALSGSAGTVTGAGSDIAAHAAYSGSDSKTASTETADADMLLRLNTYSKKKSGILCTVKPPVVSPNLHYVLNPTYAPPGAQPCTLFCSIIQPIPVQPVPVYSVPVSPGACHIIQPCSCCYARQLESQANMFSGICGTFNV